MLKKSKEFILGFVCCFLVMSFTLNVFAEPIERTVVSIYNDIRIKINGTEFIPKDANGNTIEPFIIGEC